MVSPVLKADGRWQVACLRRAPGVQSSRRAIAAAVSLACKAFARVRGIVWQTSRLIDGSGSTGGAAASVARGLPRAREGIGTSYRNHPGCRDTNDHDAQAA